MALRNYTVELCEGGGSNLSHFLIGSACKYVCVHACVWCVRDISYVAKEFIARLPCPD